MTGTRKLYAAVLHEAVLWPHLTALMAAERLIRRRVRPFLRSVTGTPVFWSAVTMALGVRPGFTCRSTAAAPATCGVACDVPPSVRVPPPGPDEVDSAPGASSSTRGLL